MSFSCLNCSLLGNCSEVDEEKLKTGYYCNRWSGVATEIVNARNHAIHVFGDAAFKALLTEGGTK